MNAGRVVASLSWPSWPLWKSIQPKSSLGESVYRKVIVALVFVYVESDFETVHGDIRKPVAHLFAGRCVYMQRLLLGLLVGDATTHLSSVCKTYPGSTPPTASPSPT